MNISLQYLFEFIQNAKLIQHLYREKMNPQVINEYYVAGEDYYLGGHIKLAVDEVITEAHIDTIMRKREETPDYANSWEYHSVCQHNARFDELVKIIRFIQHDDSSN